MKLIAIVALVTLLLQIETEKSAVVINANRSEDILYVDFNNYAEALIEKLSKDDVLLTTDNGTIEKQKGNIFIIRPNAKGWATVNVCRVIKKDTVVIGKQNFKVEEMPEPVTRIGGLSGGHIDKRKLIEAVGLISKEQCCGFDYPAAIIEFTLIATRDSTTIGMSKNIGPRYNEKSIELLNKLQANDKLIVCGISAKLSKEPRLIRAMEFIIEE